MQQGTVAVLKKSLEIDVLEIIVKKGMLFSSISKK